MTPRGPAAQLALVDRLGQEVVRPDLQRLDLLLVAAGGHHDDGKVRRLDPLSDHSAHLVPVHAWHHDVEKNEIRLGLGDQRQCLLA
jgi:hypothetical protein